MGTLQRELTEGWAISAAGDPEAPVMSIANGLFAQSGFPTKPGFVSGLQRDFGASAQAVDFESDPMGALATLNGWVSEQTHGLIPTLFHELDPTTKLVLANAVYLDAKWATPFNATMTSPGTFRNRRGGRPAEFMNATKTVEYAFGDDYQAVQLPYRASTLSMLIVLPQTLKLASFQRELDARSLRKIVHDLRPMRIDLSLPRFEFGLRRMMNNVLSRLGMPTAFKEGAANFKGMANVDGLHITEVMHGARITVDEGGTIAGAATGVGFGLVSKPPSFTADHPFLFFLRDTVTGAVLFSGRVADPSAG
jgi:serpin B